MIRINLLGVDKQKRRTSATIDVGSQWLTVACSLVLVLTVAGLGWWYYSLGLASKKVDDDIVAAQQELVRLQPVLLELQRSQQRQQVLQQRVALIEQLRNGQNIPVQVLDHVSKSLPETLWLTQMEQVASELTIQGRSTTLISLSDFVGNLGNSPLLQKPIEIVSSQVEAAPVVPGQPAASAVDLIRFIVKAQIAPSNRPETAAAPGRAGGPPPSPAPGGAR